MSVIFREFTSQWIIGFFYLVPHCVYLILLTDQFCKVTQLLLLYICHSPEPDEDAKMKTAHSMTFLAASNRSGSYYWVQTSGVMHYYFPVMQCNALQFENRGSNAKMHYYFEKNCITVLHYFCHKTSQKIGISGCWICFNFFTDDYFFICEKIPWLPTWVFIYLTKFAQKFWKSWLLQHPGEN